MDRKTQLTKIIPDFMNSWNIYKKGLKELKITNWCISSDYCFDDPNKLDVATFTIFPVDCMPKLHEEILKQLPKDIKNITHVSDSVIKFIKESKYFFSISVIIDNLKYAFNEQEAIKQFEDVLNYYNNLTDEKKTPEIRDKARRFIKFYNYVKQKSHSKKLLAQIYFVARFVSQIFEFLLVKENGKIPHWCSDRDDMASFSDGFIFYLLNIYVYHFVNKRVDNYWLCLPPEIKENNQNYPYDPFIRIPDIITGALSSLVMTSKDLTCQKEKHYALLSESITNNPHMIILYYKFNKDGIASGSRMFFETSDTCPLLRYNKELHI